MRKEVPADKRDALVQFSTKVPEERLENIKRGLGVRVCSRLLFLRFSRHFFRYRSSRMANPNMYGYVLNPSETYKSASHILCFSNSAYMLT